MSTHQLQPTVIRRSDYLHSKCVLLSYHTISGNLQNNDYQKKESVREEWALLLLAILFFLKSQYLVYDSDNLLLYISLEHHVILYGKVLLLIYYSIDRTSELF